MSILDVRETIVSTTIYPAASPGVCVGGLNYLYLLRGMPVQQLGTLHFTIIPGVPPTPVTVPEISGKYTDLSIGLPQGAQLDALGGFTLPGTF